MKYPDLQAPRNIGLTPLVGAVWRYLVTRPAKSLTMSYEKYERFCSELPGTWTFVDRDTEKLGIEHRQLKGCIIRPIEGLDGG